MALIGTIISNADFIIFCFYVVVLGAIKTRESVLATVCFALSCFYTSSELFVQHPDYVNHLVVSLCFVPAVLLSTTKKACIAFFVYSLFQWLTSGEYLFFDNSSVLIGNFSLYAALLNFCIMAALLNDRHNYDYSRNPFVVNSWIINLCRHYIFNTSDCQKSKESHQ